MLNKAVIIKVNQRRPLASDSVCHNSDLKKYPVYNVISSDPRIYIC